VNVLEPIRLAAGDDLAIAGLEPKSKLAAAWL
jgi:hypothetical protein